MFHHCTGLIIVLTCVCCGCGDDRVRGTTPSPDGSAAIDGSMDGAVVGDGATRTDGRSGDGAVSCSAARSACGGECVDLTTDSRFCGNCSTACAPGRACVASACIDGVTDVVFSEIHNSDVRFFELYNGGATAVDLAGYQIQWAPVMGVTGSFTLPTYSLAPAAFVELRSSTGTDGDRVLWLGGTYVRAFDGIALRLLAPGGLGRDFVRTGTSAASPPAGTAWTGPSADNPAPNAGQSLVRNVYRPDTDTAGDWSLTSPSSAGAYCARPGRCGDTCVDFDSDRAHCGGCTVACGGTQICMGGACRAAFGGAWISEVQGTTASGGGHPGVELHNPSADPIDLTGWRLEVGDVTLATHTFGPRTIAPGAYLFVHAARAGAVDDDRTVFSTIPARQWSGDTIFVALFDGAGTALDFVPIAPLPRTGRPGDAWFGDVVPIPSFWGRVDVAVRRNVETLDTDSAADWREASPSTPGFSCMPGLDACGGLCVDRAIDDRHCGACGSVCAAHETCIAGACTSGPVVISELKNSGSELIELFNGTAARVDLAGWSLLWAADGGSGSYTVGAGVGIDPGAVLSFVETTGMATATEVPMGTPIIWSSDIAVTLRDASAAAVDFVRVGMSTVPAPPGTTWVGPGAPTPSDTVAFLSLSRVTMYGDAASAQGWALGQRTPTAACASGLRLCGGVCVSPVDRASCGACGNVCPSDNCGGAACSL